ncbi:MAG: saccharopine dehydrogenase [Gemmatimonadetes bacterium]|nr:saccharopine dehydrogenase [Gemmatimonadota bacterium]
MQGSRVHRVLLLGAGRVGAAIARDLAGEFQVTVLDSSAAALDRLQGDAGIRTVRASVTDRNSLERLVAGADVVVSAVPGPLGFETLRRVLEAGADVVDISFFEQDALALDRLARQHGCTAIVDCGVAPGCSNLLLGMHAATMERVDRFWCAVGGLPVVRRWPFEYRAPFSPIDVIAEYNRPARFRRGGRDVTLPALSEPELMDLPGVGTVEAFNTDGLRTLLRTMPVPDMVEKTLRYPGFAEQMRMLRETGFFSPVPRDLGGVRVAPLALTASLLFDAWQFETGEPDLTVMRVIVEGTEAGRATRHTWDLLDHYDPATDTSSMARTTGYTATAAVRLLAAGGYDRPGIAPPELLGPAAADFIFADLARHGVRFQQQVEILSSS